ncbi:membrane protein [Acidobacteria bacterium Mor1]|nr:membrane protein [Acidobacteria bacterium Mor1]
MGESAASGPNKSSTGLDENVAGLLSYLLGFITGLIFFLIEKDSKFVKFHAMQSIVAFGSLMVLSIVLNFVPFIGCLITMVLPLVGLVLWILLMVKAYQGERFKLPVIGDFAEKQAG